MWEGTFWCSTVAPITETHTFNAPRPRPCGACAPSPAGSLSRHPRGVPTAPPPRPALRTLNLLASGGGRGASGQCQEALEAAGPRGGLAGPRGAELCGKARTVGVYCPPRGAGWVQAHKDARLAAALLPALRSGAATATRKGRVQRVGRCPGRGWGAGVTLSGISAPLSSILPEWRGFSMSAFRQSPRPLPSLPLGLAPQQQGEARSLPPGGGGLRRWGGTGRVHPPARRLGPRLRGM